MSCGYLSKTFLLICILEVCLNILGFGLSRARPVGGNALLRHCATKVHTTRLQGSNSDSVAPNMEEFKRKELWKSISNHEKLAVQLLAAAKNGNSIDENKLNEAHKLFAQSTNLKSSDPYIQLASRYAEALEKKDAPEMNSLLNAMTAVGVPPHVASLARQVARGSDTTGTADNENEAELLDDADTENDVDAGSTFSDTVTENIRVKVSSFYDAARSEPASGKYMFYYKVAIFNEGSEAVQVVARMWEIEKCKGGKEVVRGAGIMSTQPIIAPGDVFNYESVCPLKVFPPRGRRVLGSMSGAYTMCKGNMGQHNFTVRVSKFNLILPESAVS